MKSSSNGAGGGSSSTSSSSSSSAMSYFAAAAAGYGAANHYAAAFGATGFNPSAAIPTANNSFITSQQVCGRRLRFYVSLIIQICVVIDGLKVLYIYRYSPTRSGNKTKQQRKHKYSTDTIAASSMSSHHQSLALLHSSNCLSVYAFPVMLAFVKHK